MRRRTQVTALVAVHAGRVMEHRTKADSSTSRGRPPSQRSSKAIPAAALLASGSRVSLSTMLELSARMVHDTGTWRGLHGAPVTVPVAGGAERESRADAVDAADVRRNRDSAIVAVRPANGRPVKGARPLPSRSQGPDSRGICRGLERHGPDTEPGDLWHKSPEADTAGCVSASRLVRHTRERSRMR